MNMKTKNDHVLDMEESLKYTLEVEVGSEPSGNFRCWSSFLSSILEFLCILFIFCSSGVIFWKAKKVENCYANLINEHV